MYIYICIQYTIHIKYILGVCMFHIFCWTSYLPQGPRLQDRFQCLGAEFGAAAELSAPVPGQRFGLGRAMSGGKCRLDPPGARGWEIILFIVDLFCSYWLVVLDYGYYCWYLLILNILIIKWYLFVVYLVFIFQLYIITSLNVVTMSGIIPIIMMKWWRWSEQKRARVFARQRPLTVLTCGRTEVKTGWVHETSSLRILRLGGFEVSVWLKEARQAHEAKGTLAFWVNGPK